MTLVVAAEMRAQIALARSRGIPLTHLDSHNNSRLAPNVRRIATTVARESGISRMRPARNCGVRQGLARLVLHRSYNPVEAPDGTIVDAPSSELVADRLERLPPHVRSSLRAARAR